MSNNAHELSNRLLNALDNNYNVVDMQTVNEIISILERFNITKELLETTRLGKHVNELRRKTADPTLARRAKVLVKRWRDLVIPAVASPAHTGSNRSSAERTVRRLGGTPLTSPALQRQGLSPAVPSPRPPSRPAWGGYESDSQDVILVDDEPPSPRPPPALHAHKPLTPPVKRPPSPEPLYDEKKAKRDKKPKKRRGHGRAGTGTESPGGAPAPASAAGAAGAWRERNGTSERRRNGCRKDALDPYTALVNRMPKVGDKKVKTTQELLQQIQSRGARPASPASPASPRSPRSPDVMLIEPDAVPIKVDSPLRNGGGSPAPGPTLPTLPPLPRARSPLPPLEDEREYHECTCGEQPSDACPAARRAPVQPLHVHALHHAHIPGVNGTRAPPLPHQYAVRAPAHPARPDRFDNVVPLYKYSDYADDYCVKNMAQVPLCSHLPWTEFAPPPPPPPEPPSPPPPRPYPVDDEGTPDGDEGTEPPDEAEVKLKVESESKQELNERLKEPAVGDEEPAAVTDEEPTAAVKRELRSHRSVERTRAPADGRSLWALARATAERVPWSYAQLHAAPVLALPATAAALDAALAGAAAAEERDALGRPPRAAAFSEWHESARLGELLALPYVVLD